MKIMIDTYYSMVDDAFIATTKLTLWGRVVYLKIFCKLPVIFLFGILFACPMALVQFFSQNFDKVP
jgi:hypothetical protein